MKEYSGRDSIMPDTFYRPTVEEVRKQGKANRQGGEETFVGKGTEARPPTGHEGREDAGLRTASAFVKYSAQPGAGADRAAGQRVHAVVLEVRPAQHSAVFVAADGCARTGGDPGVRGGDV